MAKKDTYYFDTFTACASLSCDAARMLYEVLTHYDVRNIEKNVATLHQIEHQGDQKKHDLLAELVRAFITPIERDDIVKLAHTLDDVTDAVEDILIHMDITRVTVIREDAIAFAELLIRCCEALHDLMKEFGNFKHSKRIEEIIIQINALEEEGDKKYIAAMQMLHTTSTDLMEVIVWRDIYKAFEKVCDACEHAADIVESVVIGNI